MEDLRAIFEEIRKYDKTITADIAVQCATRIFISQNIESGWNSPKSKEEPATDKQVYFLKKNKVNLPSGLTKKEALEIIRQIKENEKYPAGTI